MSLTGCPQPSKAAPAELCAERVELLALLWQVLDGDAAYCANPRLLMITKLLPELQQDQATQKLAVLRKTYDRDRLIKLLTGDAHGVNTDPTIRALAADLDTLSNRWDALLQGLAAPLTQAYHTMRDRAAQLTVGLDPVRDMERLTGEHDSLTLRFCPSLFLPPPQTGRHSSLVSSHDGGAAAYLFFGFPLDSDPAQYGINAPWLLGGAWHYPVTRFIERHWPAIAPALASDKQLETALSAALQGHRDKVVWPGFIVEHLVLVLKCALCRASGLPDRVHRDFARTQGAAFFDWFVSWISDIAKNSADFVTAFELLPETLAAKQRDLIEAADMMQSGASSINFAMASRQPRVIVVPDHWDVALREKIRRRWSLVARTIIAESEWNQRAGRAVECMIAFGEVGRDQMVDDLLDAIDDEPVAIGAEHDLIVALLPQRRANSPWQLAIGVRDAELAGSFSAEHTMKSFQRIARFSRSDFASTDKAILTV
jgi:hypothetical protein